MKYKPANIAVILLASLIILMTTISLFAITISDKYMMKTQTERFENRYIAESGIDIAVGFFENYIANQTYSLEYVKTDTGYVLDDDFSPYLPEDIRLSENGDSVSIDIVNHETNSYMANIGFLEFKRSAGINLSVNTFNAKENFKISRLCIDDGFVESNSTGNSSLFSVSSRINPIYLTVRCQYKGGEVLCNVKMENILIKRQPFKQLDYIGESANIQVQIDTSNIKITYENYQNYKYDAR